nr:putative fructose-bisphosphate aldolase [Quercus suber]
MADDSNLSKNVSVRILKDAEARGYGVQASIVYGHLPYHAAYVLIINYSYNVEHILGVVRAAERKQSPLIIQLFPWAITVSDGLLVRTAADAASRASVPIAIHLDHCQDEKLLRLAAETLPFDSIMIDMSHHEKSENLRKTREYVTLCHSRGIATEAEPGRLEGGEDGVADTVDMEGVLTTPDEVDEFAATKVDFLAPAFGNLHGEDGYTHARLDFDRERAHGKVRLVLHGTNGYPPELLQKCIKAGISKINVNKLVLEEYTKHLHANAAHVPLTRLMEEGIEHVARMQAEQMDICGSTGKASGI